MIDLPPGPFAVVLRLAHAMSRSIVNEAMSDEVAISVMIRAAHGAGSIEPEADLRRAFEWLLGAAIAKRCSDEARNEFMADDEELEAA